MLRLEVRFGYENYEDQYCILISELLPCWIVTYRSCSRFESHEVISHQIYIYQMLCALCLVRHSVWYVLRMMKSDDFLVSRLSAGVTYPWEVLAHLYTFPPLFLLTVSLGLLRGVPLFRLPTYWAAYPSLLFPALFRTERRYSTCALLVFSCLDSLSHSLPRSSKSGCTNRWYHTGSWGPQR